MEATTTPSTRTSYTLTCGHAILSPTDRWNIGQNLECPKCGKRKGGRSRFLPVRKIRGKAPCPVPGA